MNDATSDTLADSVSQLHWASQLLSATCDALLPRADDDSQSSLAWDDEHEGFTTRTLPGGQRLTLDPAGASIGVSTPSDDLNTSKPLRLDGSTLDRLKAELASGVSALEGDPTRIAFRHYDMPDHPVARGEPFNFGDHAILRSLAANWRAAHLVLESAARHLDGGGRTPTLLWPHHFDLGNLVLFETGANPASDPSVGLGYVARDGHIAEPYFYANPYVPNRPDDLPDLPLGSWTDAWFGAVLTESDLRSVASDGVPSSAGRDAAVSFLTHVIDLARGWR